MLAVFAVNFFLAPARLDRKQRQLAARTESELCGRVSAVEAERDEAKRELAALQEPPDIDFDVIPRINLKMRPIPGDWDEDDTYAYDSEAFLRVRNAAEGGGQEATARGVTPEIEVAGARHVGWDIGASRDFPPTRVEHVIYVAFKRQTSRSQRPRSYVQTTGEVVLSGGQAPSMCGSRCVERTLTLRSTCSAFATKARAGDSCGRPSPYGYPHMYVYLLQSLAWRPSRGITSSAMRAPRAR
jgi:hypothetical protein